jgi:DNA-binding NarL/FixJ family response regulator
MPHSRFRLLLPPPFSAVHICESSACETARLSALSFSAWSHGDLVDGIRLAAAAGSAHAEHSGHAEGPCAGECVGPARVWHAALLVRIRELASAARVLAGVEEQLRAEDAKVAAASQLCAADLAFARGDVDTAVGLADKGAGTARRTGLHRLLPDAHTVLALGALRQGNLSVSRDFAEQLRDDALLGQTVHSASQCAWAAAQLLEVRGGVSSAAHLVAGIITDDQLVRELLSSEPAAAAWLVRAALALEEEDLARRVVAEAARLSGLNAGIRSLEAAWSHADALLARAPERVVAAAGAHRDPWARASAYEDAGKLLSTVRQERDRAVEVLEQAVDEYANASASRDARRVVSRLRSLGVRRGRYPKYAGHDGVNVGSLTNTEVAVADLVSQGFTNSQVGERLFISGHTVAFHLKKIFRKMDVASRVELTRTWSRIPSNDY